MSSRRRSRELAMQALFYMDMRKNSSEEMIDLFLRHFISSKKPDPFFTKLAKGVMNYRHKIDQVVEHFASNWKISRMSCVDRNIIRVAAFELLYCDEIPAKVSINEAIEIGKKFGDKDSGAFINGILDSIRIAYENGQI